MCKRLFKSVLRISNKGLWGKNIMLDCNECLTIQCLRNIIYSMVIQGGSSGLAYKLAMQWPASFCSTLSIKVIYYTVYMYVCGARHFGYP